MCKLKVFHKLIIGSVTIPIVNRMLGLLDGKQWVPIVFLFLTRVNTNDLLLLQVLHNVQVKTKRKVFIITAWPFWPMKSGKDPFFRSFVINLTPNLRYIWIPAFLHTFVKRHALNIMRFFQVKDIFYRSMGMNATIRYSDPSTIFETDILSAGEKVVMKIPKSHESSLEEQLRSLGIRTDDWFVSVHARDNGWMAGKRPYGLQHSDDWRIDMDEHRNVDIKTYIPAIQYIINQGGKVIRMGDPAMEPLAHMSGVIDYPFSSIRSLLMDLYIVAKSRFVIGCEAGFTTNFPVAFGVPLLVTNLTSTLVTSMWPYAETRVILKPVQELQGGRILSLSERSDPTLATIHNAVVFEKMGYRWLPNTSGEILEGTKEMFQLLQKDSFENPMTREQEYFDRCVKGSLEQLWPSGSTTGDTKWSHMKNYRSRVSAGYAREHFRDEALTCKLGVYE